MVRVSKEPARWQRSLVSTNWWLRKFSADAQEQRGDPAGAVVTAGNPTSVQLKLRNPLSIQPSGGIPPQADLRFDLPNSKTCVWTKIAEDILEKCEASKGLFLIRFHLNAALNWCAQVEQTCWQTCETSAAESIINLCVFILRSRHFASGQAMLCSLS